MSASPGLLVVSEDTVIKGQIRNCRQLEVHGYIEGEIAAQAVLVHRTGRCYGTISADNADVHGDLQGEISVKNLINIRDTGSVSGNVRYGQMAMEAGGSLTAEVRNVPPSIAGDLDVTVDKGRSVRITLQDLNALDPDDKPQDLVFTVSNARNGFITLSGAPSRPVSRFTQADLAGGSVLFMHDGTDTAVASFDVVVADHAGATSGAAQTVRVSVRG